MSEAFLGVSASVVQTARGPVEVARTGTGPAVLLVHGTPGSWRQAVALAHDLEDAFDVLLPSRPGYGNTPLSSGRTPDDQARLYAALLDSLGIDTVAVVGISGGGPSSLAMARIAPQRVRQLVLCCAVNASLIEVPRVMRLMVAVPGLGEAGAAITRGVNRRRSEEKALRRAMAHSLTADERHRTEADPRVRQDLVDFLHSHALAPAGVAGLRNDARQFVAARRAGPDAEAVAVPMLVLHGDADTVVPVDHARHHATLGAGAELELFPDAGHVFLFTRRREAVRRIRGFLGCT